MKPMTLSVKKDKRRGRGSMSPTQKVRIAESAPNDMVVILDIKSIKSVYLHSSLDFILKFLGGYLPSTLYLLLIIY